MLSHEQEQVMLVLDAGLVREGDLDPARVGPVLGVELACFEDGGDVEVRAGGQDLGG